MKPNLFKKMNVTPINSEEKLEKENKDLIDSGFKMDEQEVPLLKFEKIETAVAKLKAALILETKRKILTAATVAEIGHLTRRYLIEKGLDKESDQTIDKNYSRNINGLMTSDQFLNLMSTSKHVFSPDFLSPALRHLTTIINHEQSHSSAVSFQAPLTDDENDDTPTVFASPLRHRKGFG